MDTAKRYTTLIMSLAAGTRLGPYEIVSPLGAGGMGEVYKARDTRLDRVVAIKITKEQFSERFKREAHAIAALNHPYICQLYDIGPNYLVMEYIEGQTLKGPLPLDQVLTFGGQICAALTAAHKKGIIHRDLKPANILATASGIKLLDFGLAKHTHESPLGTTQTMELTDHNTIVGTLQYMAPEQLEGKEVDARSDIFSFGAVLYEMVTGKPAFRGESQASVVAAIMEREPQPLSASHSNVPRMLEEIVRISLAKNPDARWQSARDITTVLQWASEGPAADPGVHTIERRQRVGFFGWGLAAVLSIGLLAIFGIHYRSTSNPACPVRFDVSLPDNLAFEWLHYPVISPNGETIVFGARNTQGKRLLFLRSLNSSEIKPLAGNEEGILPFWSPNSRNIAYFSDGKLKKIDAAGGPSQILCDAPLSYSFFGGGSWGSDGTILFTVGNALYRVSANGGDLKLVRELDKTRNEIAQDLPQFLPDGRHYLYASQSLTSSRTGIYVGSLNDNTARMLMSGDSNAYYSRAGFLVYSRQNTILAQPFEVERFRLTGEATVVAAQAEGSRGGKSHFTISETGTLVYRPAYRAVEQLAWFGRDGNRLGTIGEPVEFNSLSISPDDKRLVISRIDPKLGRTDLWLFELLTGMVSRFTFDPANENDPHWSPDGEEVLFSSSRKGAVDLYRKSIRMGDERVVLETNEAKWSKQWLGKRNSILFISTLGKSLYELPLDGGGHPKLLMQSEFGLDQPRVSPDGRLIAYVSSESGRSEVYMAQFPSFAEKRMISDAGGFEPLWKKDSKEVYYVTQDGKVMMVQIKGDSTSQATAPRFLFQSPTTRMSQRGTHYCVNGNGTRFIFGIPVGKSSNTMAIMLNWDAGLKR